MKSTPPPHAWVAQFSGCLWNLEEKLESEVNHDFVYFSALWVCVFLASSTVIYDKQCFSLPVVFRA